MLQFIASDNFEVNRDKIQNDIQGFDGTSDAEEQQVQRQ
jgi:hypothetical protein